VFYSSFTAGEGGQLPSRLVLAAEASETLENNRKSELKFETAICPSAYVKKAWEDSCFSAPVWDETKVS
jgi:hypothetical protein